MFITFDPWIVYQAKNLLLWRRQCKRIKWIFNQFVVCTSPAIAFRICNTNKWKIFNRKSIIGIYYISPGVIRSPANSAAFWTYCLLYWNIHLNSRPSNKKNRIGSNKCIRRENRSVPVSILNVFSGGVRIDFCAKCYKDFCSLILVL